MKKLIALAMVILVGLVGIAITGCSTSKCTDLSCDMGNYQINFSPLTIRATSIPFVVENKCAEPITIIWDESAYIDESGRSMRIIHSGVRLMDRNVAQPQTVIVPGTSFSDEAVPSENISFDGGDWHTMPLLVEGRKEEERIRSCVELESEANHWANILNHATGSDLDQAAIFLGDKEKKIKLDACLKAKAAPPTAPLSSVELKQLPGDVGLYLMIKVGNAKKPQNFDFRMSNPPTTTTQP